MVHISDKKLGHPHPIPSDRFVLAPIEEGYIQSSLTKIPDLSDTLIEFLKPDRIVDLLLICHFAFRAEDPHLIPIITRLFPWHLDRDSRDTILEQHASDPLSLFVTLLTDSIKNPKESRKLATSIERALGGPSPFFDALAKEPRVSHLHKIPKLVNSIVWSIPSYCDVVVKRILTEIPSEKLVQLEELNANLGYSLPGILYQLGREALKLSKKELLAIESVGRLVPGYGQTSIFAHVPRTYWLHPRFLDVCERYRCGTGEEYRVRGPNLFTRIQDPHIRNLEDWLINTLNIRFFHRYLLSKRGGSEKLQWSQLEGLRQTYMRLKREGSNRAVHCSLLPGFDRYDPWLYGRFTKTIQPLHKSHDVLFAEIPSMQRFMQLKEQFRSELGVNGCDILGLHYHGNNTLLYMNDDLRRRGKDTLTLAKDHLQLKHFAKWIKAGGTGILEVCQGGNMDEVSKKKRNLLLTLSHLNPQVTWIGQSGTGYLGAISFDDSGLHAKFSGPTSTVVIPGSSH